MIIAFAGQKGGVGKSTAAISIAVAAMERGARVLLVDADPQGTARTWSDVANETRSGRTPTVVAMGATMHKPGQLASVAASYDLTVIDCPPRHGDVQRSALMVADLVVLPCGPSAADAWALAGGIEVVREAQAFRDFEACILITRKQPRTALAKGARKVLESSGLAVLSTELTQRIAYQEAIAAGMGVTELAPRDPAASEVRALLDELEGIGHGKEEGRGLAPQAVAVG